VLRVLSTTLQDVTQVYVHSLHVQAATLCILNEALLKKYGFKILHYKDVPFYKFVNSRAINCRFTFSPGALTN